MNNEAMQLALEALETERPYLGPMPTKTSKAITALREALAEQLAQQEPKPHKLPTPPGQAPITDTCFVEGWNACCDAFFDNKPPPEPLIVIVEREVPAQRKPLTDEKIANIATSHPLTWVNLNTVEHRRYFARAIEAAHGIKGDA